MTDRAKTSSDHVSTALSAGAPRGVNLSGGSSGEEKMKPPHSFETAMIDVHSRVASVAAWLESHTNERQVMFGKTALKCSDLLVLLRATDPAADKSADDRVPIRRPLGKDERQAWALAILEDEHPGIQGPTAWEIERSAAVLDRVLRTAPADMLEEPRGPVRSQTVAELEGIVWANVKGSIRASVDGSKLREGLLAALRTYRDGRIERLESEVNLQAASIEGLIRDIDEKTRKVISLQHTIQTPPLTAAPTLSDELLAARGRRFRPAIEAAKNVLRRVYSDPGTASTMGMHDDIAHALGLIDAAMDGFVAPAPTEKRLSPHDLHHVRSGMKKIIQPMLRKWRWQVIRGRVDIETLVAYDPCMAEVENALDPPSSFELAEQIAAAIVEAGERPGGVSADPA